MNPPRPVELKAPATPLSVIVPTPSREAPLPHPRPAGTHRQEEPALKSTLTRRGLLAGTALSAVGLLAACSTRPSPTPVPSTTTRTFAPLTDAAAFVSGASCIGAANGVFGDWRGRPVRTASTWGADGSVVTLVEGAEYGAWTADIDYAPQYAFDDRGGFSWSALGAGTYDTRLRRDLVRLRRAWGDREGAVTYRFQHEFNGDWYAWSVDEGNKAAFVSGWQRFAGIFRDVLGDDPRFRIAWCANGGTPSKAINDIRSAWPGDEHVDVVAVDYYDFFTLKSAADWHAQVGSTDGGGGPVGIGAWQTFAADHGKPLAVPEWGNQYGDNPLLIEVMHDFFGEFAATSGTVSPGQVVSEAYFNQRLNGGTPSTNGDFRIQVKGEDAPLRPNAAKRYRELWQGWLPA